MCDPGWYVQRRYAMCRAPTPNLYCTVNRFEFAPCPPLTLLRLQRGFIYPNCNPNRRLFLCGPGLVSISGRYACNRNIHTRNCTAAPEREVIALCFFSTRPVTSHRCCCVGTHFSVSFALVHIFQIYENISNILLLNSLIHTSRTHTTSMQHNSTHAPSHTSSHARIHA